MQIKKAYLLKEFKSEKLKKKIKVFIVAGEVSGDLLGEGLIIELKKMINDIEIFGVGGSKMIAQGLKPIFNIKFLCSLK